MRIMKPLITCCGLALHLCLSSSRAQSIELGAWSTHPYGSSAGGIYCLIATLGQSNAGTMNSGIYTLEGGFWSITCQGSQPSQPVLTITRVGTNLLISWPSCYSGFV